VPSRVPRTPDHANRARGQWGEDLAAGHYRRLGYEVLDRNWRGATGELDLVVHRGGMFVFVEVKTRRTADYGPAAAAVTAAKQRRIRSLAVEWLRAHEIHAPAVRFDVVAITGNRLELIDGAF
jgi:putative endonuclease